MRGLVVAFLFLWTFGSGSPALARERLAVLIVVEGDPAMADNLTEVVIAKLAEGRDRELVGLRELRGRLGEILKGGSIDACLVRPGCLSEVGTAAGTARAVIGKLRREGHEFSLVLMTTNTQTGTAQAEVTRKLPDQMGELISGIRAALDDLFGEKGASTSRATPPNLSAVDHVDRARSREPSSAPDLTHNPDRQSTRNASSLSAYATYGLAALAVVSFSAAVVVGSLSEAAPVGKTRAATQSDLEARKRQATLANSLYVAGGTLLAATAGIVIWHWR
jgi:hypothetical protein